jgi:hypothetical protein
MSEIVQVEQIDAAQQMRESRRQAADRSPEAQLRLGRTALLPHQQNHGRHRQQSGN